MRASVTRVVFFVSHSDYVNNISRCCFSHRKTKHDIYAETRRRGTNSRSRSREGNRRRSETNLPYDPRDHSTHVHQQPNMNTQPLYSPHQQHTPLELTPSSVLPHPTYNLQLNAGRASNEAIGIRYDANIASSVKHNYRKPGTPRIGRN